MLTKSVTHFFLRITSFFKMFANQPFTVWCHHKKYWNMGLIYHYFCTTWKCHFLCGFRAS